MGLDHRPRELVGGGVVEQDAFLIGLVGIVAHPGKNRGRHGQGGDAGVIDGITDDLAGGAIEHEKIAAGGGGDDVDAGGADQEMTGHRAEQVALAQLLAPQDAAAFGVHGHDGVAGAGQQEFEAAIQIQIGRHRFRRRQAGFAVPGLAWPAGAGGGRKAKHAQQQDGGNPAVRRIGALVSLRRSHRAEKHAKPFEIKFTMNHV